MANQLIPVAEMTSAPRGRKRVINSKLLADLTELSEAPSGTAIVLADTFGPVAKEKRQQVRAQIVSHWLELGEDRELGIKFSNPEGIPQVFPK
jgi:hypothetical protein